MKKDYCQELKEEITRNRRNKRGSKNDKKLYEGKQLELDTTKN